MQIEEIPNVVDWNHRGIDFLVREGTNDRDVVRSIMGSDSNGCEYEIDNLKIKHGRILDIGGHLGVWTFWMLQRYPEIKEAVIVEPIPENLALSKEIAKRNGFEDKIIWIQGVVGSSLENPKVEVKYGDPSTEAGRIHTYIGNGRGISTSDKTVRVKTLSLVTILSNFSSVRSKIDVMKVDCEGGELGLLLDSTMNSLSRITYFIGEYHSPDFKTVINRFTKNFTTIRCDYNDNPNIGLFIFKQDETDKEGV